MLDLLMNNEVERQKKEVVVARCEMLSQHLPGETAETHEKPQDSRSFCRDSNPRPSEYETGVLTTRTRCSVCTWFRSNILHVCYRTV
jgi:hypothetical protein